MNIKKELEKLAEIKGLTVKDYGNGHYQLLGGPLLVNYYPHSRYKTAYVAGTTQGVTGVDPEKAVSMCFTAPALTKVKDKRPKNTRKIRQRLLKKIANCRWCNVPLTIDTSTLEHIIPLHRGGLDNASNRTLACAKCNGERGNNMPELEVCARDA